jgi:large subunit ribosomal protein L13
MPHKTLFLSKEKALSNRRWILVDAKGKILGRLASHVATLLRGKHRADWTPHVDSGDHIVIINAEKVILTGRKLDQKSYYRHSGYPGHLKEVPARKMLATHPDRLLKSAVKGMLPKNKLGRAMFLKLKVYPGENHPHMAQKPELVSID